MKPNRLCHRLAAGVLALAAVTIWPARAAAQGGGHAYVSVGVGATDVDAGVHMRLADGPVGLFAELGVGWVFLAGIGASYHPLAADPARTVDPFLTIGYTTLQSSEQSSHGTSVGAGLTVWATRRFGLRVDGFKFLPITTGYDVPPDARSASRYWGLRAGLAIRVR